MPELEKKGGLYVFCFGNEKRNDSSGGKRPKLESGGFRHYPHEWNTFLFKQTIEFRRANGKRAQSRRIYTIIRKLYPYNVELLVRKKMRLKKNNVYICRIREGAKEILTDLDILHGDFQVKSFPFKIVIKNKIAKKGIFEGGFFGGRISQ